MGEIRLHGQLAGLLYRWDFNGRALDWVVSAQRYKLDPLFFRNGTRADTAQLTVVLNKGPVRFEGIGTIWTSDPIVDGHTHKAIVIRGRHMRCQSAPPPAANGTEPATS